MFRCPPDIGRVPVVPDLLGRTSYDGGRRTQRVPAVVKEPLHTTARRLGGQEDVLAERYRLTPSGEVCEQLYPLYLLSPDDCESWLKGVNARAGTVADPVAEPMSNQGTPKDMSSAPSRNKRAQFDAGCHHRTGRLALLASGVPWRGGRLG